MKRYSEACIRNSPFILEVLRGVLGESGRLVEIGAGTGQHAVDFARGLPGWTYQPCDLPENHESILAWREEAGLKNLEAPLEFNLLDPEPPVPTCDAVLCVNTIHIAPDACTPKLFEHASAMLADGGDLVLYGPFKYRGKALEPSNEAFDQSLRERGFSGLKFFEDLVELAKGHGFEFVKDYEMPANNHILHWRK